MLGIWLLAQRKVAATLAMIGTGLGIVGVTVVLGGAASVIEYLAVVRQAAANPTDLSIPGVLMNAGIAAPMANLALLAILAFAATLIVLQPREPVVFLLAVLGSIYTTTVVRYDSIGIIVAAGAVWAGRRFLLRPLSERPLASEVDRVDGRVGGPEGRSSIVRPARLSIGIAVVITVIAIADSVITGGLDHSSLTLTNQTGAPIIARLSVFSQEATFGYRVPADGSVMGWLDVGGASPPVVTIWSESCHLLGRTTLPRTGGEVVIEESAAEIKPTARLASLASYTPECAAELKAARIWP